MKNKSVIDVLKNIDKNEIIYYCTNPGNAGDALIAAGTFQVFDELNLKIKFIDLKTFNAKDKIIIYAGGGNLNHIYGDAKKFIQGVHEKAKLFILLPHTITANEDLLGQLGNNCIIFAREKVSYEHMLKFGVNCQNFIDHDMALHLDIKLILSRKYPNTLSLILRKLMGLIKGVDLRDEVPSLIKLVKVSIFEFIQSIFVRKSKGIFYRDDVESSGNLLPEGNADLSVIYEFGTKSRELIDYTVWRLLRLIMRFNSVETDRLHISVASALLNKSVDFYPNSYFKCKAVYEYSLNKRFPNITWNSP